MPNALTSRLATMFGMPEFSADPAAYLEELDRMTKKYRPVELERAADTLVRTFRPTRFKPWPSPNEIMEACSDASEHLAPVKSDAYRYPDWSPKAVGRAYGLIRSEMGRQAADEGWIHPLWDFCRKHGRLPDAAEIAKCRKDAAEGREAFEAVATARTTPATGALLRLKTTLAERCDRLQRHAWGEDVPQSELRIQEPELSATSKRMTGEAA